MNGLTLLAPAGLLALAALAVPLLIHLFSRSRGKRVLVGNIALYRQAQRQRVTEIRLVQWLLLLLRLLLLTAAALLLANLARQGLETLPGQTAYVTPAWLAQSDTAKTDLAEFDHRFVLGPDVPAIAGIEPTGEGDPWSLLAERLAGTRHDGKVHVFAQGAADQFPDQIPMFPGDLSWHLATGPATTAPAPVLAVTLAVAPGREGDADALLIALDALKAHRNLELTVSRASMDAPVAGEQRDSAESIMIWLGTAPAPEAPEALVASWGAVTWLEDRPRDESSIPTEAKLPRFPQLLFSAQTGQRPRTTPPEERVLWWTRDGRPLLRESTLGPTRHLIFEDRLGTGGLAAQSAFPEALLRLLLGEDTWRAGIAHARAEPTGALALGQPIDDGPSRPLAPWLAIVIAVLFMLERLLSERRSRTTTVSAES